MHWFTCLGYKIKLPINTIGSLILYVDKKNALQLHNLCSGSFAAILHDKQISALG